MIKPTPTLRQLRYLVALADHQHFGHAAEACLVTQSTLSAGLQELEGLLGVVLVERTKRRVMVTPLGNDVVDRARALLRDAEAIVDLTRAAAEPLSGDIRLGVIPTIGPYLLPRALPGLRSAYPKLKLFLREDLTARLLEKLRRGELDAAVIALPYELDGLASVSLGEDPFVLIAPPDHPVAQRPTLRTDDLADVDLLLLEEGHCLREHALASCALPLPAAGEGIMGTSLPTLVQMVANGLGVTLLPQMALPDALRGTDLVSREVTGAVPREIALVWRKSSPRSAEFRLLAEALSRPRTAQ